MNDIIKNFEKKSKIKTYFLFFFKFILENSIKNDFIYQFFIYLDKSKIIKLYNIVNK
jgi:hypothetical protein